MQADLRMIEIHSDEELDARDIPYVFTIVVEYLEGEDPYKQAFTVHILPRGKDGS